ncbi:hypothetical protein [Pikeienuella sp. HZG-20]|uniref:allophanate hydrolase-related protein n=1 Tax=Paludibacillus litoralis TaxID=3133267 RepID=UPI0030EC4E64
MMIFVIGSGLREICGDQSAFGLTFIRPAVTVPMYRLFSIDRRFAALVEEPEGGAAISGELCELSAEDNEALLLAEPKGVEQKSINLSDGRLVVSAVSTLAALPSGSLDITKFGSFSAFIKSIKRGVSSG